MKYYYRKFPTVLLVALPLALGSSCSQGRKLLNVGHDEQNTDAVSEIASDSSLAPAKFFDKSIEAANSSAKDSVVVTSRSSDGQILVLSYTLTPQFGKNGTFGTYFGPDYRRYCGTFGGSVAMLPDQAMEARYCLKGDSSLFLVEHYAKDGKEIAHLPETSEAQAALFRSYQDALVAGSVKNNEQTVHPQEDIKAAHAEALAFRKSLKVGDDTHCGLVLSINRPVAVVQSTIGQYGLRIDDLYPAGRAPCTFAAGRYVAPNLSY